ncbi:bifunctional metallophosphatase/5'-nucleotidase [Pseudoroseomonas sp. WGS1072]|uniref:bifunctional metallophosphatase/5'-nucleotidase n=1 Tax=Roseomonas sp. WGS1072 TaxID=3366816 RepID=UPI003BF3F0B1
MAMRHFRTTRRALLAGGLALPAFGLPPLGLPPLGLPGLRRAAAETAGRLTLLHLNDVHARHDGQQASGAACQEGRPCLGGSARMATALAVARRATEADGRAVLHLDAGDQFTGSLYHTAHRGLAEAAVQRATGCQAMALGNHEFDHGPLTLAAYAAAVDFPLLSANLDMAREPALAARIRGHVAFRRGGLRIGVIGLTTETTPQASSPGPGLRFTEAAEAALREIAAIRAGGPATILVLSHLGLAADRALAAAVPGIDAIIGGHSHTLLADGLPGAEGPHPLVVEGRDRAVRIVQAGAYGRWLGRLDLDLGADGRVAGHGGMVRAVDESLAPDPAVAALVAEYGAPLAALRARAVGPGAPGLSPAGCRQGECRLGNLLADAMLAAAPGADAALTNGGGLRAGLPEGVVSWGALLEMLPFGNTLSVVTLRGADLWAALEAGLARAQENGGGFPQVAGMRLRWRPGAPPGERLASVEVGGAPWRPEAAYRIVTNDFLRRGGDGYAALRDAPLAVLDNGRPLEEALADWLRRQGAARTRLEGRITEAGPPP